MKVLIKEIDNLPLHKRVEYLTKLNTFIDGILESNESDESSSSKVKDMTVEYELTIRPDYLFYSVYQINSLSDLETLISVFGNGAGIESTTEGFILTVRGGD